MYRVWRDLRQVVQAGVKYFCSVPSLPAEPARPDFGSRASANGFAILMGGSLRLAGLRLAARQRRAYPAAGSDYFDESLGNTQPFTLLLP
jgi:hypothetical protein